jgi:hypothetical protein
MHWFLELWAQYSEANRLTLGDIDIDHPLQSIELDSAVRHFAKTNKLEDLTDILLRGAHMAKDPEASGGASAHTSKQGKEAWHEN